MNAQQLMREAAEWRLFGLLFERPNARWAGEVRTVAREVGDEELRTAASAWLAEANEGDYLALLGPGGAASPREVGYRGMGDPGWILSDIAQFHQAFAYQPAAEDPPDHVSVMAGFIGYLWLKEAFARECGDEEAAAVTAAARGEFLNEHLAYLAAPLAERLTTAGGTALARVAQLLAARVPAPPVTTGAAPADYEGGCGNCETLAQEVDLVEPVD
jgi:hypothetical protein